MLATSLWKALCSSRPGGGYDLHERVLDCVMNFQVPLQLGNQQRPLRQETLRANDLILQRLLLALQLGKSPLQFSDLLSMTPHRMQKSQALSVC